MKIRASLRIYCLVSFLLPLPASLAVGSYDVSYFWSTKQQAAKAYASKVKRVLGPSIAKQIKVVRNEKSRYGVIYNRDGSYKMVSRLARYHAELLYRAGVTKQKGNEAACPIPNRNYPPMQSKRRSEPQKRNDPPTQSKRRSAPQKRDTAWNLRKWDTTWDSRIEADIDQYIKGLRRKGRLANTDRTSFVVYDVTQQKKVVSINEDRTMMAASLIKNFVMLAYFHEVKQKRLEHTSANRSHLRRMIQKSANSPTNYFIKLLGGPRSVDRILKRNYPFFKQTHIVEYIPNGGRTYRNTTSGHDLNRFYNQLWLGKLPYSEKMKYYLGLPNGDRIYDKTCIPSNVRVYHKTGTVYGLVADSGILVITDPRGKQRAYVFTGMIEDATKTNLRNRFQPFSVWVKHRSDTLRRISEAVYEYIYEVHYGGHFDCRRHGGKHLRH